MKLSITHLAPYLPYGLKWKFDGEDLTHDVVGLDITNRGVKLVSPYNDYGDCEISSGKPILLPMSSLYTEMEDGTIPAIELAKIANPKTTWTLRPECNLPLSNIGELFGWTFDENEFYLYLQWEDYSRHYFNQLGCFQYLFSHHFDVWNLIGQNLAIDKRSVNENKGDF